MQKGEQLGIFVKGFKIRGGKLNSQYELVVNQPREYEYELSYFLMEV